jgi:hypothetical protein
MAPTLRVGDLVEVLSAEEILATLDDKGELENLPFMPEMLEFCGRRLTVHKVAHKLCDTITATGLRKMENAVHLTGSRCDGASHGGCQTACSTYWKEDWLKKVSASDPAPPEPEPAGGLPLLQINSRKPDAEDGSPRYSCQATELNRAAPVVLPVLEFQQYVMDVRSGNAGVLATIRGLLIGLYNRYQDVSKAKFPRWLLINKGLRFGLFQGPLTGRTPAETLDLKPGELVRIKTREQIIATLDKNNLNKGMGFEDEMAVHCGKTRRVQTRIEQCIDERTGELLTMKTACIVLEDLVCEGVHKRNCPREFVPFWREIWLERVPG